MNGYQPSYLAPSRMRGSIEGRLGDDVNGPGRFLDAIGPEAARALLAHAVAHSYGPGQALVHAGQVPQDVFLLRSGRVKVSVATTAGRELLLDFRGPGEVVGELSALDERPRSATIVALEHVEALAVSHDAFRACLVRHPSAALVMLRVLSRRLRGGDAKRIQLAGCTSLERVAACLVELCDRFGEAHDLALDIPLPISQEELAGWAGSSLESITRALATMRRMGWIETRRRGIRILDPMALKRAIGHRPDPQDQPGRSRPPSQLT